MRENFPNVRPFQNHARDALREARTIRPGQEKGFPYGTSATALDYRIRYYFVVTPPNQFVASAAADRLEYSGAGPEFADTLREQVWPSLEKLTKELNPVGRRLDRHEEERLLRFCFVLALFDEFYRAGVTINSPLLQKNPDDFADWLTIPKQEWIEDLCQMSWLFYKRGKHLFSKTALLNPHLRGSRDIGGADADMIIGNCLFDIKASVNPKGTRIKKWLYQAMGYVLLDYDDEYKLDGLSFYLARQGVFLDWSLAESVDTLADGKSPLLQELRDRFRHTVSGTQ